MSAEEKQPYIVLARKYRPQSFDAVIGQDALIRTVRNAIESGRIPHAYMLTGVRGTGKTTTARLIARALNYTGPDGTAGPTAGPTDDCAVCRSIAEGRCADVMEMDAASRTGVDDIREILDGVRYAPVSARYKVYIIDEVHMLSKGAFNALLKTLEEPPEHVIFIFATTEIRKVPVTVLSRCQRFDLRRVDTPTLAAYYRDICAREGAAAEDEALSMIARAADGSVRDGLSLLDQAISRGADGVSAQTVRDMLGLADRGLVLDMLDHALKGECAQALDIMDNLHRNGGDALTVLQDMLDFVHVMTRMKAVPAFRDDAGAMAPETRARAADMAQAIGMPALGRAWQILLKGVGEVQTAQNAQAAAEMVMIRLAYAADLPDPADLLRRLKDGGESAGAAHHAGPAHQPGSATVMTAAAPSSGQQAAVLASSVPCESSATAIRTLADIESVLYAAGQARLAGDLYHYVHLVRLEPGLLEIRPEEAARRELAAEIGKVLSSATGQRWVVSVSGAAGAPTLAQQAQAEDRARVEEAAKNPVVSAVISAFPGTTVKIRTSS